MGIVYPMIVYMSTDFEPRNGPRRFGGGGATRILNLNPNLALNLQTQGD
jgi:hypothetical protein